MHTTKRMHENATYQIESFEYVFFMPNFKLEHSEKDSMASVIYAIKWMNTM